MGEIEMLRKQQQLAADQEKNAENLLIKQNELDDLRTRFENEKDPVKKEELRKQWELETDPEKKAELERLMAGKSRELEALKKQAQLTVEQEKRAGEIFDKELELAELQRKFDLETDPIKKAELAKQFI